MLFQNAASPVFSLESDDGPFNLSISFCRIAKNIIFFHVIKIFTNDVVHFQKLLYLLFLFLGIGWRNPELISISFSNCSCSDTIFSIKKGHFQNPISPLAVMYSDFKTQWVQFLEILYFREYFNFGISVKVETSFWGGNKIKIEICWQFCILPEQLRNMN